MKILKFGGTSVGSAARMKAVVDLIADGEPKIVVLSAMSGTTNQLLQIADYLRLGNAGGASDTLLSLKNKYRQECADLGISFEVLEPFFTALRKLCLRPYEPQTEKDIVSHG